MKIYVLTIQHKQENPAYNETQIFFNRRSAIALMEKLNEIEPNMANCLETNTEDEPPAEQDLWEKILSLIEDEGGSIIQIETTESSEYAYIRTKEGKKFRIEKPVKY